MFWTIAGGVLAGKVAYDVLWGDTPRRSGRCSSRGSADRGTTYVNVRAQSPDETAEAMEKHRIESAYHECRATIRSLFSLFQSEEDAEQKHTYRTKLKEIIHFFVAFCVEHRIHLSIHVVPDRHGCRSSYVDGKFDIEAYRREKYCDYQRMGGDLISGFGEMALQLEERNSPSSPLITAL